MAIELDMPVKEDVQRTIWACPACGSFHRITTPSFDAVGSKGCWGDVVACASCGANPIVQVWANGNTTSEIDDGDHGCKTEVSHYE